MVYNLFVNSDNCRSDPDPEINPDQISVLTYELYLSYLWSLGGATLSLVRFMKDFGINLNLFKSPILSDPAKSALTDP